MTYIDLANNFWLRKEEFGLTTLDVALYFYLLNWNNRLNWCPNFKRRNNVVMADLDISFKTLQGSRDRLKQANLIDFKTSTGVGNVDYAIIRTNKKEATSSATSASTFGKIPEVRDEVSAEVRDEVGMRLVQTINKSKIKTKSKTIKKDNTNVLSQKSEPKFDFRKSLIDYGFQPQLVDDWLLVRKSKKAANTVTALKAFIGEFEKFTANQHEPININELLEFIVSRSWSGFKASWDLQDFLTKNVSNYDTGINANYRHSEGNNPPNRQNSYRTDAEKRRAELNALDQLCDAVLRQP